MHKSVWMLLVRSVDERALSYSTLGGSQRGNNRKGRENEESGRYFAGAFVYIFSLSLSLSSVSDYLLFSFRFFVSHVHSHVYTAQTTFIFFTATQPRAMCGVTRKTDGFVRVFCVCSACDILARSRTSSLLVLRKMCRQPPLCRWFSRCGEEASELTQTRTREKNLSSNAS